MNGKINLIARERLENCLTNGPLDRVPVSLWRHFPVDDQTAESLAAAIINFQNTYNFDFVKVTPPSSYCVKDWGVEDEWRGSSEGTREYIKFAINRPEDWTKLRPLDPRKGSLGKQLNCLKLIVEEFRSTIPVIQTIFNPLSQAKYLVSQDLLLVHLRRYPQLVLEGLRTITQSTCNFIDEAKKTGISGVFFAIQHAQYGLLSSLEFQTFGCEFDLEILKTVQNLWFNVLHLHGEEIMFDQVAKYPVQVINWHDKDTPPTLKDGKKIFPGVVCGGLQRVNTMVLGTPEKVIKEAREAIIETGETRFILGTGCVVPIIAPQVNIKAARLSVDQV